MSPEREAEFERLASFLNIFWTALSGKKASECGDEHPYNALFSIAESVGKSKAFVGLKQAVNDCLAMSQDLSEDQIRTLDKVLVKENAPTISGLRRNYWRKVDSIRKRGRIKNDTEFYLIKDIADEDEELLKLLGEYEAREP